MSAVDLHAVVDGGARWAVAHGEARVVLSGLPAACIDAVVTDPPAGIGFMGATWDHHLGGRRQWIAKHAAIFAECVRVAKPGTHAIVWALPRTSHWTATALEDAGWEIRDVAVHLQAQGFPKSKSLLKPAAEHWILAKAPGPLRALNVDACRIGTSKEVPASVSRTDGKVYGRFAQETGAEDGYNPNVGRWPANATLDEDAAALLDAQSGTRKSGAMRAGTLRKNLDSYSGSFSESHGTASDIAPSAGGASRFFYVSKCKGNERKGNPHPTAKPVDLMRWLCRLVTPADGLVLDAFAGSGTTGVAAREEGYRFIGVEAAAEYAALARERIAAARGHQLALAGGTR